MIITQTVATEVTFCMAHCLAGLEGLKTERCKSVHGHNYKLRLVLGIMPNEDGHCFFDFSDLKKIATEITDPWDHVLAMGNCNEEKFNFHTTLLPGLQNAFIPSYYEDSLVNERQVVATWHITAENLSRHFALAAHFILGEECRLGAISHIQAVLWETDKSFASTLIQLN